MDGTSSSARLRRVSGSKTYDAPYGRKKSLMRLAALAQKNILMNSTAVISIVRDALELTLIVSAPLLLTALAAGLVVSVFQAATQINEMTLSFIPKLIAVFVAIVVAGPWMLQLMIDYTQRLFTSIPGMVG